MTLRADVLSAHARTCQLVWLTNEFETRSMKLPQITFMPHFATASNSMTGCSVPDDHRGSSACYGLDDMLRATSKTW